MFHFTGTFSGAVSCGGTLTCGTDSIFVTDGTEAFSVTPTKMRALYSILIMPVGTTAVGTLFTITLGAPFQHTSGSGLYSTNPTVVSTTLAAGSYNITAMDLLSYNNSGNPVLTNM